MMRRSTRPVRLAWEGRGLGVAPALPLAPLRAFSHPRGTLLQGDNLDALRRLAATHAGRVMLAYLDPPFLTNRVHDKTDRETRERSMAFDDRWPDLATFLETLGERLRALRELLAPEGCVVVHVDPKTSHYVKVLCDEIFGDDAFASEVVWRYRRWPSKTKNFQRVHDVLLRYRKDPRTPPRYHQLYEPLAPSTVTTWGRAKQRAVVGRDGRRLRSSVTREASAGVPMGDVWEIGVIAPVSRERTGYPSQKPEALLTRLVTALTDPGDLVLDPYAGSGTTLAVAAKNDRAFLGIDESPVAIRTCEERLRAMGIPLVPSVSPLRHREKTRPRPPRTALHTGLSRAYGSRSRTPS